MESVNNDISEMAEDLKYCLQQYIHENDLASTPFSVLNSIDSPYLNIDELPEYLPNNDSMFPNVMHINIRSIPGKIDKLKELVHHLKERNIILDYILVCETFLRDETKALFNIPGYNLITENRHSKPKGGVAIYVRDQLQFKVLKNLSVFHEGEFESIFIETLINNKSYAIGEIYRIPDTSEITSIERYERILSDISKTYKNVIIGTDQNFDYLKLHSHIKTAELFNLFLSFNLLPTITKPTRITHSSATLIDNIYVQKENLEIYPAIIPCDISDHFPVICCMMNGRKKEVRHPLKFKHRHLNTALINEIKLNISNTDWTFLYTLDVNTAYDLFSDKLNQLIDEIAPERTITIPPHHIIRDDWMTIGLMKSSLKLNKMYRKCTNKPKTHPLYIDYVAYRNAFNKIKRTAKHDFYKDRFEQYKTDIKKTWKLMNSLIGKTHDKSSIQTTFKLNNSILTEPQEIANGFCTYFSTIGSDLARSISQPTKNAFQYLQAKKTNNLNSFFVTPTTPNEIQSIINSLKPKKSSGFDKLNTSLLKELGPEISHPLEVIINKSFIEGTVPSALKIAKVVPIYKSNERDLFSNYRPVSLLPVMSKVLEKAMHKRLLTFFEYHNMLYDSQYGFRKNRSTTMAALELINDAIQALENNESMLAVFLDLSKAFDTINHSLLLSKLEFYGIRGVAYDWFKCYLSNRSQYVVYNNETSSMLPITCGVPQGSILGPLLFIIYMNDLPDCLEKLKSILFADDTSLYHSDNDINRLYEDTNTELDLIQDWFRANQLSLNTNKTNYMLFSYKKTTNMSQYIVKVGDKIIEKSTCVKFLGFHVDDKLTWQEHINIIKSKLASSIYAMNRIKKIIPTTYKRTLYFTLVYPYLNYGIILWGATYKCHTNKVVKMQKRAVRNICNARYNDHSDPLFLSQNILKFENIYQLEVIKIVYNFYNKLLPNPLMHIFLLNQQVHNRHTRQQGNLYTHRCRTRMATQSVKYKGPLIWNNLPCQIKEMKDLNIRRFTKHVSSYLLNNSC